MFNHKANRLLRASVLTIAVTRSVASGSIISSLANLYTDAKEMDALQDGFNPGTIGGIYDTQLQIALDNDIVGGSEAIDQMYINYSSRQACQSNQTFFKTPQPLQKSDIINILLQTNQNLGRMKQAAINSEDFSTANEGFKESCQKLLTCMGETEENYGICVSIIEEAYEPYAKQSIKQQEMISDFYGIQFFSNGTLDDSSYDLLVDMELIGNIMYSDNKKPTQTIYYRMPTAAGGGTSQNPLTPSDPSIGSHTSGSTNTNGKTNTTTNNNLTSLNTITISNDNTTTENYNHNNNTVTSTNTTTNQDTIASTGLPLFSNNICIDGIDNTENTTPNETPNNNPNPFIDDDLTPEDINTIRNDYMDYMGGQYTSYTPTDIISDAPSNPRIPGENNTIGAALADMNLMDQINSCIDSCDDSYSGTDALVCKASCMCGATPESSSQDYNKYLDFKIKFCRIPTQTEAPYTSTTTVHSIEEIVDAINNTLTALRASGALNKRNETQEYLDTSLRNLNIADSFVFSFNIATKTSPNTKDEKIIQKEADQSFAQATKSTTIYSPSVNQYNTTNTSQSRDQNKTITQETQKILATMTNIVDRQETFANTLSQMDTFRRQFALQMTELNNITTNMKVKAENAD